MYQDEFWGNVRVKSSKGMMERDNPEFKRLMPSLPFTTVQSLTVGYIDGNGWLKVKRHTPSR